LVGGVEWEERLVRKIGSETGIPTLSTSRAVVEAIKSINGERIAVATPYTDDINELERAFLESNGISVLAMKGLGLIKNLDIGWTERSTVEELVRSVADGADIVFISCTNLPTISIVDVLERELKIPIITSNQASLWAALCGSGVEGMKGYGELLRSQF